jgi:hypothetical protein
MLEKLVPDRIRRGDFDESPENLPEPRKPSHIIARLPVPIGDSLENIARNLRRP